MRAPSAASEAKRLSTVLSTLQNAIVVIDCEGVVSDVNLAAEQLFDSSAAILSGRRYDTLAPGDSPLCALVRQALERQSPVSRHGAVMNVPRAGLREMTIQVTPMADRSGGVVASMFEHTLALRIGRRLTHRGAARSVSAMAAMLAHEVRNPLSGIRGAAQLLDTAVAEEDRTLTRLIRDETDRIVTLVDRMEAFSDQRPLARAAVNIHEILEHVRRVSENGFARGIRFIERYDPSLPPVSGDRDQLVQVFLNLMKNAAEACAEQGGRIAIATAYQRGMRVALSGFGTRMTLPLAVSVQDNGSGVAEDMKENLFDPFVTSKRGGSGLGLALVTKIVNDHGGVIEFDSQPGKTIFRVMLPTVRDASLARRGRADGEATAAGEAMGE